MGLPTVQIPSRSGGSVSGISDVPGLTAALAAKVDDPLSATDIPGGLVSGKILATLDTSGTGDLTGSAFTTAKFTTSINTIATSGAGFYTLTKAGLLHYEFRLILPSSRDLDIRVGLNGTDDVTSRKTDTEFVLGGLMPVAIGEYFEFVIYNYGSDVTPTSGRFRAVLQEI